MPYVPPVGSVALHLAGVYTPPVGSANLSIGASLLPDRTATITARTQSRAHARLAVTSRLRIAARTAGARVTAHTAYDPNLLSDTVAVQAVQWSSGESAQAHGRARFGDGPAMANSGIPIWQPAPLGVEGPGAGWSESTRAVGSGSSDWRESAHGIGGPISGWSQAPRAVGDALPDWRDATPLSHHAPVNWIQLDFVAGDLAQVWRDGLHHTAARELPWGDGAQDRLAWDTWWQDAGYPRHFIRPPKPPKPPPPRPPTIIRLCLGRPLPGTRLTIGLRCKEALPRRFYQVFNSATLVRLPDRVELPCTGLTIATDSNSWCWSLSATLIGTNAYSLIAPQAPGYLPVEVEATVNGYVWQFLLDTPAHARAFASDSVSLSGRSRSAWLAAPYSRATSGTQTDPTTAAQAAEQALADTGWGIDWSALPDWAIPADVLSWSGTPIDRLIQLVKAVDGCLLSDPADDWLYALPRYPSPPWTWSGLQPDILIPESALHTLKRDDDRRPLVNGVYVGGTVAGVLANAKITGTAGDLQADMIADPLICDDEGIAARARALAVLSAGGPGSTLTAETLLLPAASPHPPILTPPGKLVALGSVYALSRGVSIRAERSRDDLAVWQTITLEQRETEA